MPNFGISGIRNAETGTSALRKTEVPISATKDTHKRKLH